MTRGRHAATEQQRGELGGLADVQTLRRARGHQRAGRYPYKGVQGIPAGIDAGDLVGHELDQVGFRFWPHLGESLRSDTERFHQEISRRERYRQ